MTGHSDVTHPNMPQNIGLQAKILSTRTFTIFVVMALLTTFATTPLASFLYPPWYQKKLEAWKRGEIDWDTGAPLSGHTSEGDIKTTKGATDRIRRLLVYLTLDNMPAILDLVSLFGIPSSRSHTHPIDDRGSKDSAETVLESNRAVRAHGIRLLQLTDRDSSVMTVSQVDEYSQHDPVVNIFRTVAQLNRVAVSGEVAVMPESRFAEALVSKSSAISSDLLLVPWSETGHMGIMGAPATLHEPAITKVTSAYSNFIKPLLDSVDQNIAIFFSQASSAASLDSQSQHRAKLARTYSFSEMQHDVPSIPVTNKSHHIFLPYFGGKDDQLALLLVLQLCEKPDVTATIVRFANLGASSSADDHFAESSSHVNQKVKDRVKFHTVQIGDHLDEVIDRAVSEVQPESKSTIWTHLIVLGRRHELGHVDTKASYNAPEEVKDGLGVVAGYLVSARVKADLLVVQAKGSK